MQSLKELKKTYNTEPKNIMWSYSHWIVMSTCEYLQWVQTILNFLVVILQIISNLLMTSAFVPQVETLWPI